MKTKTSYVKQKTKKFKLTLEFDVTAKDTEEAEKILKRTAATIIKEHGCGVIYTIVN